MLGALSGYGVQLPLPHHEVRGALHLDLVLVVAAEQDPVAHLDGAHVLPDAEDLSPDQTFGNLGGCRDDDPGTAAPLAGAVGDPDHDAVVQHLDLELRVLHQSDATAHGRALADAHHDLRGRNIGNPRGWQVGGPTAPRG